MQNGVKQGFTLAEVLITLGVIGVVSAITIPMLVSHYNKYITETRLEAVYSTILQGFRMAEANESALLDSKTDDADVNGYSKARSKAVFEQIFMPVFTGCSEYPETNVLKHLYSYDGTVRLTNLGFYSVYYVLNNGTLLGFTRAGNYDGMIFNVYINPNKKRLLLGKDVFQFLFRADGNGGYEYSPLWGTTYNNPAGRLKLIEYCKSTVTHPAYASQPHAFCTELIVRNNFHIPSDYPVHF